MATTGGEISRVLRILTVGDGDLTFSLSLCRAYGSQLELYATTLVSSPEELCSTYSNSTTVLEELKTTHGKYVTILFGIDATNLSRYPSLAGIEFDFVLFNHPHLGLMTSINSTDEQRHAQRHFVLLAHYLASVKSLLTQASPAAPAADDDDKDDTKSTELEGRMIHLCLSHDQPITWRVEEAANRQGLKLVKTADTVTPFHSLVNQLQLQTKAKETAASLSLLPHKNEYCAPRRYRNGNLGSRHHLGRFGYMHRRTHGDNFEGRAGDMNVGGSTHFFFGIDSTAKKTTSTRTTGNEAIGDGKVVGGDLVVCSVCGSAFSSRADLEKHLQAPALPDPPAAKTATTTKVEPTEFTKEKAERSSSMSNGLDYASNNQPTLGLTNAAVRGEGEDAAVGANKKQPTNEISSTSASRWVVLEEHCVKRLRLRRFLQHVAFKSQRSQKDCNFMVTQGEILINGVVAHDTSRLLKHGDVVESKTPTDQLASKLKAVDMPLASVPIVASFRYPQNNNENTALQKPFLVVANKPVGMRTKGDYDSSSRTLEQLVSYQLKDKYRSLSTMETGCNGLCVLQRDKDAQCDTRLLIRHEFTLLVHGHVPSGWDHGINVEVPWKCVRRWNRRTETFGDDNEPETPSQEDTTDQSPREKNAESEVSKGSPSKGDLWDMKITCIERTSLKRRANDNNAAPPLCTLKVSTACLASGTQQAIILYLRKQRYPCVGDRLCQKEYSTLPRSFRNRIKKKLMIGCFRVVVTSSPPPPSAQTADDGPNANVATSTANGIETDNESDFICWTSNVDVPEKYGAMWWQSHWENSSSRIGEGKKTDNHKLS